MKTKILISSLIVLFIFFLRSITIAQSLPVKSESSGVTVGNLTKWTHLNQSGYDEIDNSTVLQNADGTISVANGYGTTLLGHKLSGWFYLYSTTSTDKLRIANPIYLGVGNNAVLASYDNTGYSNSDMTFKTALGGIYYDRFYIASDGKIGMGTTSPSNRLHIQNDADASIYLKSDYNTSGANGDNAYIKFINTNLTTNSPAIIGTVSADDKDCEGNTYTGTFQNSLLIAKPTGSDDEGNAIHFGTRGTLAMTITYNQKVGIQTNNASEVLDVNGNARFRSVGSSAYDAPLNLTSTGVLTTSTSDVRLKTNIKTLGNSLENIMKLRGVNFTWKSDSTNQPRIGVIAQEIEKVYPEFVYTNPKDGYKGVRYAEITAVLIEAIKEQQKQIEGLKNKLGESKNDEQANNTSELLNDKLNSAQLLQNNPNPFEEKTDIQYVIPETAINAAVYIYDMQGRQIKKYDITAKGKGIVTISGGELNPGMYFYALIVDGKEVANKKMILTD